MQLALLGALPRSTAALWLQQSAQSSGCTRSGWLGHSMPGVWCTSAQGEQVFGAAACVLDAVMASQVWQLGKAGGLRAQRMQ